MPRPFIIGQEAWLSDYADRLGIPRNTLSDDQIRSALAFYHAAYLPTAATVERRTELDLQATYARFGFEPNVPTLSTAALVVTVATPPAASPLTLPAGFLGVQGSVQFMAQEPLTIPVGSRESNPVQVKSMTLGAAGSLSNDAARISSAVGWLRGASIVLQNAVPGKDGDDLATIQRDFAAYASNPKALVQASDHAYWAEENFPDEVERAVGIARANISYARPQYDATMPASGHLSVALFDPSGEQPGEDVVEAVKAGMLKSVLGTIEVTRIASADDSVVQAAVLSALDDYLNWRTWDERNRAVRVGDMWALVRSVPSVAYVNDVSLRAATDELGNPSTTVMALEPWELPVSGFYAPDIEVVGAV